MIIATLADPVARKKAHKATTMKPTKSEVSFLDESPADADSRLPNSQRAKQVDMAGLGLHHRWIDSDNWLRSFQANSYAFDRL